MKMSELENRLKGHAQIAKSNIAAPFDLKTEIKDMEEKNMSRQTNKSWIRKPIAIAAVLALCIMTVTLTPIANSIKGFFKDIVRFDGAITGTEYTNATNDIKIDTLEINTENGQLILPLDITFENKTEAPFPYIQEIAVSEYKILDANNKEIAEKKNAVEESVKGTVSDGKVLVYVPLDENLKENETYFIQIDKMYGLSKADAPLHITGTWKCEFTR